MSLKKKITKSFTVCVISVILPHRWLSRLSMAVAGYSEQEKMRQEQGEISHRAFS